MLGEPSSESGQASNDRQKNDRQSMIGKILQFDLIPTGSDRSGRSKSHERC